MPSGYVTRYKGKAEAEVFAVHQGFNYCNPVALTTASTRAVPNIGVLALSASSAAWFFLGPPVAGNQLDVIVASPSSNIHIMAATTGSIATFDGTNFAFVSTGYCHISLVGLSTSRWGILSVYPTGTTAAGGSSVSAPILTTST